MSIRMRQPYILGPAHALVNAGAMPIPINITDPIMDLYIRMYATNGDTNNISNSIIDVLTRVDIVDGSDVLFSLGPEEIMALSYYHYKESLTMGIDERKDVDQSTIFKIPFGIGRYHPEIAFDPTRFANPTLMLTWNLAAIRAVGADAFVDESLKVSVMADVIDRAPVKPTGFLMHKEVRNYVSPVSGMMPTVLPVDYPYRTLFVRSFLADTCPKVLTTKGKHDLNEDKYVPFEIEAIDWMEWLKEWYGLWHQGYEYVFAAPATETRNPYLRGNLSASIESSIAACDPLLTTPNCQLSMTNGHASLGTTFHTKVDGNLPFETFAWLYGDPDEPEEWLKVVSTDKSRLRLTHGPTAGLIQVFMTQLRKY